MNLINDIVNYSMQIGIEITGITGAEPLTGLKPFLEERARKGLCVPFENGSVSAIIDPRLALPGCRSIICLAWPYFNSPGPRRTNEGPYGKVARMARCRDYHLLLENKANLLIKFLERLYPHPFNYRILVDKGPLLERAFAYQTDGIIGENTFFITPKYGSWVTLGLILLDISLPPWPRTTRPQECLRCGRCREACPTGALYASYRLDPRQCLSYITQARGVIPHSFRKPLGSRIYGCDTCQEVCPLNEDKTPSPSEEISAAILDDCVPLIPLLAIDHQNFSHTFGRTAAGWRGLDLIRRNVIVALGNSRDHRGLEPLINVFTHDPQPLLRLHAAWSIGQLGGFDATRVLAQGLKDEPDEKVRKEIRFILGEGKGESSGTN